MIHSKVLIFGQSFNDTSGGGITLTNLFKGWPKDRIAVAFLGHGLSNVTTDICEVYYQLGCEEHRWLFPFNLIQRKFESGIKTVKSAAVKPSEHLPRKLRYRMVNHVFYPLLRWLGVLHFVSKISVSEKFANWLQEFKPDVLYFQVSTREEVLFAHDLMGFLKKPGVIHVMDDWISTVSNKGPFSRYWTNKINSEFKNLLDKADLNFSISDAMSAEYLKRYNNTFFPFHNPIDLSEWKSWTKKEFGFGNDFVKILYSGRIGIGISECLFEVAEVLDSLNREGYNVKFHIQTTTRETSVIEKLQSFKSVVINPLAKREDIPKIFSDADILVLANDFNKKGLDYLMFSMPTKASEYMISGTPILVYSPEETAVSQFFIKNECGCCVSSHSILELKDAFISLIGDEKYRMKISYKAVELATERFDASKVRLRFQEMISSLKNT